jgi:hypothetical protein
MSEHADERIQPANQQSLSTTPTSELLETLEISRWNSQAYFNSSTLLSLSRLYIIGTSARLPALSCLI